MDTITDDLVASSHGDHASLFTAVYTTFSPAVAGYLRAGGVDDPEGVTHDVFLALYPRLKSVRGGAQGLRTLIFSIAHARYVDHHRRRRGTPAPVEYDSDRDHRLTASAEDQALDGSPEANALLMLEELSEDHREVLRLRIIAELSLKEVAVIMKKSPGAVAHLQQRALASLRNQQKAKNGVAS
ncbi:RNA polymerase sigma factor [Arthrobacter sp. ISL-30]|uniref:RNA polymerase sigma factor n=1 Tax=Arthrobacter sp. ISL-30 TaxID=2819109 RepID=UPI001BEB8333|nr:RNA polymerase sigma factor [Arthrobacter sp. ISL-30]MBT2514364.1 RNA polymerase sigma factor [Arthrobacter sp. ISL-30]